MTGLLGRAPDVPNWVKWVVAGGTMIGLVVTLASAFGDCGPQVGEGETYLETDDLIRLGSDVIRVYHVIYADDEQADLLHIPSWKDLVDANCVESDIISSVVPYQRIPDVEEIGSYVSGRFKDVHRCR